MRGFFEALVRGGALGPVVEIIEDPQAIVEAAADLIDGRARRPTSWMQRAAGRHGVDTTPLGGVPLYEGRACCYAHLNRFEGRSLELPFETVCPECRRRFRVTLGVVRR